MLNNIDFDILLEYLGYLKTGTLQQFNKYIDNLDYNNEIEIFEYSIIRRIFSRLSHIEFDYTNRIFSVCPPTLLMNKDIGILSGYRTKDLLRNIKDKHKIEIIDNYYAPKLIKVEIDDIDKFQNEFPNIRISKDFSQRVLDIIPNIEQIEKEISPTEYPLIISQPNINFYNTKSYRFEQTEFNTPLNGLYRALFPGNNKYYFFKDNNWYEITKDYGFFMAHKYAQTKNLIQYDNNSFKILLYVQFPELIDRALTMLSGINPHVKNNYTIYENIDYKTSEKIIKLLKVGGANNG